MKRYSSFGSFILGSSLGALYIYFLDPSRGKFRKALIRDKAVGMKKDFTTHGRKYLRNLLNRTRGIKIETQKLLSKEKKVSDDILIARVRSELGRIIAHPRSIQVSAQNGIIALSGTIPEEEVSKLISCVKRVSGVKSVVEKLDIHHSSENIAHL
ncbi:MAG: BON domain-containing protein [Bacteriovoracaceae bacterium]